MTAASFIENEIQKTQVMLKEILSDADLLYRIETIVDCCVTALRAGHKILFAGNGGSAADSQHMAAELVSRFNYNRPALAGIALTTDTSALTAIGNDYGYEYLFARQVEALGQSGDVLIAISTSGKSPNILKALQTAKTRGLTTIGFCGKSAPQMAEYADHLLAIPSSETPKVQEGHIVVGHIICALIEESLHGEQYNPLRNMSEKVL